MSETVLEVHSAPDVSTRISGDPTGQVDSKSASRVSLPVLASDEPASEHAFPPPRPDEPAKGTLWASERLRLVCICWTLAQAGAQEQLLSWL